MAISRHVNRVVIFQTLFAYDFRHFDVPQPHTEYLFMQAQQVIDSLPRLTDKRIPPYVTLVLTLIPGRVPGILQVIARFAPEWPVDQINPVDRCILLLSIFEMLYVEDTPDVVALNEAIELAKQFGNEKSPKFINGVLHQVLHHKSELLAVSPLPLS